jgi:hypothetical protein
MTADRIYAALLHLYPRSFREEYGQEMLTAFREMYRRRTRTRLAFWSFVLADTVRTAGAERLDTMRWLATAICGLLVTTATADAVAWTYRYFYHPYFEGVTIRVVPYGIALGLVLGGSVSVAQWLLFPAEERRARNWALASAVALPIAILLCGTAVMRAIAGLNPVAANRPFALDVIVLGLAQPTGWVDLMTQFAAMATSALIFRSVMLIRFERPRHAH